MYAEPQSKDALFKTNIRIQPWSGIDFGSETGEEGHFFLLDPLVAGPWGKAYRLA
jgi:hypothetical protein